LKSKNIELSSVRSVIRLGSSTECGDTIANGGNRVEINTVESIKNSASKLLMKKKFTEAGIKTAMWLSGSDLTAEENNLPEFPIVAKSHFGSKGRGNTLIKSIEEFQQWKTGKNVNNYIFEKFFNYGHEFRLHITEDGCFYTCRKALKKDVPEDQKWRRHDDICVWFLEDSVEFYKPNSWDDIVANCVNALVAIGADLLSFDVKVQSPIDKNGDKREYQDFILLECNSASSMDNGSGELSVCAKKYIEEIPKIIKRKING
jgi:hypothetical protein